MDATGARAPRPARTGQPRPGARHPIAVVPHRVRCGNSRTAGPRAETRRRLVGTAQAEGPLREHTLRVNDVGIAFVRAARELGDECGPESWRHEIAHPISPARGRRPADQAVADALLTYLQTGKDGSLALHQRWIELDRGTARPAEHLAGKITRYTRLRYHPPAAPRTHPASRCGAATTARAAPVDRARRPVTRAMRLRIQRTLVLHQSDPARGPGRDPPLVVALDDLTRHGPFAPIFTTAERPGQAVDWLGEPQPKEA